MFLDIVKNELNCWIVFLNYFGHDFILAILLNFRIILEFN